MSQEESTSGLEESVKRVRVEGETSASPGEWVDETRPPIPETQPDTPPATQAVVEGDTPATLVLEEDGLAATQTDDVVESSLPATQADSPPATQADEVEE